MIGTQLRASRPRDGASLWRCPCAGRVRPAVPAGVRRLVDDGSLTTSSVSSGGESTSFVVTVRPRRPEPQTRFAYIARTTTPSSRRTRSGGHADQPIAFPTVHVGDRRRLHGRRRRRPDLRPRQRFPRASRSPRPCPLVGPRASRAARSAEGDRVRGRDCQRQRLEQRHLRSRWRHHLLASAAPRYRLSRRRVEQDRDHTVRVACPTSRSRGRPARQPHDVTFRKARRSSRARPGPAWRASVMPSTPASTATRPATS